MNIIHTTDRVNLVASMTTRKFTEKYYVRIIPVDSRHVFAYVIIIGKFPQNGLVFLSLLWFFFLKNTMYIFLYAGQF